MVANVVSNASYVLFGQSSLRVGRCVGREGCVACFAQLGALGVGRHIGRKGHVEHVVGCVGSGASSVGRRIGHEGHILV